MTFDIIRIGTAPAWGSLWILLSWRSHGLDPAKNCQDRADGQKKGKIRHMYKVEFRSPWMVKIEF